MFKVMFAVVAILVAMSFAAPVQAASKSKSGYSKGSSAKSKSGYARKSGSSGYNKASSYKSSAKPSRSK